MSSTMSGDELIKGLVGTKPAKMVQLIGEGGWYVICEEEMGPLRRQGVDFGSVTWCACDNNEMTVAVEMGLLLLGNLGFLPDHHAECKLHLGHFVHNESAVHCAYIGPLDSVQRVVLEKDLGRKGLGKRAAHMTLARGNGRYQYNIKFME